MYSYRGALIFSDITELIPEVLQLEASVRLGSPGRCYKLGEYEKSCALRSVFFCSQSDGGVITGLLTLAATVTWLGSGL